MATVLTRRCSHPYFAAGELIPLPSKVSFMTLTKLPFHNGISVVENQAIWLEIVWIRSKRISVAWPSANLNFWGKWLFTVGLKPCSSQAAFRHSFSFQLLNTQQLFLKLWETLQEPAFSQRCLLKAESLLSLADGKLMERRISSCSRLGFNGEKESTCDRSKFIW